MAALRGRLGKAVRRLRLEKKYSQEAFADAAGVHRTYMGSVERGEVNISLDNLEKIAHALRMSLSDMIRAAEQER